MATIEQLLGELKEFERTPQNVGYDLRLDLADIILRHLDGKELTQKKLAELAGMKVSFVNRIVHADSNCTFDVAGRLLHALGVRGKLLEQSFPETISQPETIPGEIFVRNFGGSNGKKEKIGNVGSAGSSEFTTQSGRYTSSVA